VDFEEGVRRFEEFKKSDPILASVEVVHIGTAETLERFEVTTDEVLPVAA